MKKVMKSCMFALATGVATMITAAAQAQSIPMLEFPLKNSATEDRVYRMSDHVNAVFVLEAYSVNCGPCNSNAPNVKALAKKYEDNARVQVVDLGTDANESDYTRWISRHKPVHPVVQDVGRKAYNALKESNFIPQVFVVNCRGEKLYGHVGVWSESTKAAIDRAIAEGLETTCQEDPAE